MISSPHLALRSDSSPQVARERVDSVIEVELNAQLAPAWLDAPRLCEAVRRVLSAEGIDRGTVSLAVVDDATIHAINRRHLEHDYPTDVLSFVLESGAGRLEGEVVVSAEMAAAVAADYGWSADRELLLYVIHGSLHLAGYDDQTPQDEAIMRAKEAEYLRGWNVTVPAQWEDGA